MTDTLSLQLAAWSSALTPGDVPEDQRALARLRVLDSVGLILVVLDSTQGKAALEVALRQGGVGESTVIGAGARLPAGWAALAHATLAHCRDFDDTFADSVVHPGSVVVAVALAVGEATGARGDEILTAIAAGYEVAARLGAAAGRKLHARGFHSTGIVGPFSAAVTAARLYGLDGRQTAQAMGLAGSMSGGLMEFIADGSWSKWLHTGWAAHGGIVAAEFSRAGFPGPLTVLEGDSGLYNAFIGAGEAALGPVTAGLGRDWRGGAAEFKYYPCAHVIQPYIDVALDLRAEHSLVPDEIAEVSCAIAPWCVPIVCEPREPRLAPATELQAIASLPFLVAAALVDGEVTLDTIAAANLNNTEVLALTRRVVHVADPALGSGFDGRLTIHATDGRAFEVPAVSAAADGGKVRAKFRRNAARACDPSHIAAIEAVIDEEAFGVGALMKLLDVSGTNS